MVPQEEELRLGTEFLAPEADPSGLCLFLTMLSRKEPSYPTHTQDQDPSAPAQPCLVTEGALCGRMVSLLQPQPGWN